MGEGLKRAFAAARATRKKPGRQEVTPSCGCVLCDLGLLTDIVTGQHVHTDNSGRQFPCTRPALFLEGGV